LFVDVDLTYVLPEKCVFNLCTCVLVSASRGTLKGLYSENNNVQIL